MYLSTGRTKRTQVLNSASNNTFNGYMAKHEIYCQSTGPTQAFATSELLAGYQTELNIKAVFVCDSSCHDKLGSISSLIRTVKNT